jgi:biotin operon repressor
VSLNLQMTKAIWLSTLPKGVNKMVLLCMCHHFNDKQLLSWPSVPRLALMCGMSERTIQNHIRVLQHVGILVPRIVRTGFSTRYAIQLKGLPLIVFPTKASATEFGQPVDDEPVDNFPEIVISVDNSGATPAESAPVVTEIGTTPPQISTATPAESAPELSLTLKSTVNRTSAPALPDAVVVFDEVNPEVMAAFAAVLKAKRKGKVTAELIDSIRAEATLAGLTLEQALKACNHKKWARFEAAWMTDAIRAAVLPAPAAPAVWTPTPSTPAAPEVVSATLAAYRAKVFPALAAKPAAPAMPTGASDIRIAADAPPWAVAIVTKQRTGQPVSRNSLNDACAVLKIDPAILRRAAAAPSRAACMH